LTTKFLPTARAGTFHLEQVGDSSCDRFNRENIPGHVWAFSSFHFYATSWNIIIFADAVPHRYQNLVCCNLLSFKLVAGFCLALFSTIPCLIIRMHRIHPTKVSESTILLSPSEEVDVRKALHLLHIHSLDYLFVIEQYPILPLVLLKQFLAYECYVVARMDASAFVTDNAL
jgi:hypothetical protein